jgi:hypothetical protein
MITASWNITIDRVPEDVFDFVADLDNEPQFNPDVSNIVKTSDGPIGLGTVYEEDFKRVGHYVTTIDVYERPAKLGFDARNRRTDAQVRFSLAPSGAGATDVSCTIELTIKGPMRLMEPLMTPMIRKQITTTRGPMLKQALEGGGVT